MGGGDNNYIGSGEFNRWAGQTNETLARIEAKVDGQGGRLTALETKFAILVTGATQQTEDPPAAKRRMQMSDKAAGAGIAGAVVAAVELLKFWWATK